MVKLFVKVFLVCFGSFLVGLSVAGALSSCGSSERQSDNAACVAVCVRAEPAHLPDCVNACAAHEDDAELATLEVKENCDTGEPLPAATSWTCSASCQVAPPFGLPLQAASDCGPGVASQPLVCNSLGFCYVALYGLTVISTISQTDAYVRASRSCPIQVYDATRCSRVDKSGNVANAVSVGCHGN